MNTITLTGYIPNAGDVIHGLANLKTPPEVTLLGAESYPSVESMVSDTFIEEGTLLVTTSNILGTGLGGATYVATTGVTANTLNPLLNNGYVAVNVSQDLTLTMTGALNSGEDYSQELNDIGKSLNESKSLFIDIKEYSLTQPVFFNNGFKSITSMADNKVTSFLELPDETTISLFNVNMDETGVVTNYTDTGLLTLTDMLYADSSDSFDVSDSSQFAQGDCIRINKHICKVARIDGQTVITDRTVPVDIPTGSTLWKLDKPNTGSKIEIGNIDFNGTEAEPRPAFGLTAGHCVGLVIDGVHGTSIDSKVCEIIYNADSKVYNVTSKDAVNINAGRGYALRISNGNDNFAQYINSSRGRHCVDISFSHRNLVSDSNDYGGIQASFLTHSNGCVDNIFDNCNMYGCDFGYLANSDGGDARNTFRNCRSVNSRTFYRPTKDSIFENITVINTDTNRDLFVPRSNGESELHIKGGTIDTAGKLCNVTADFLCNFESVTFRNKKNFGLVKEGTVHNSEFHFNNCDVFVEASLLRNNTDNKIFFNNSNIYYSTQVFGEYAGEQHSFNSNWKNTSGSTTTTMYTITDGKVSSLVNSVLDGNANFFRNFTSGGIPSGTILLGGNSLVNGAEYGSMNLLTFGNTGELTLESYANATAGTALAGTAVNFNPNAVGDTIRAFYNGSTWLQSKLV